MNNQLKTILLLGLLSVLLVSVGGMLGTTWLYLFLAIALAMNVGAYLWSDVIVLRSSGARLIDAKEAPALHAMVEDLAARAGIPMPRLAIVPDPTPNAFATGRNPSRAVVAVTEGLLRMTDSRELRGVLAHELAHVANRDTLVATIAATGATVISYVGSSLQWAVLLGSHGDEEGESAGGGLLMAIVAPIVAMMLQMGISRSREYLADEYAAKLTGDPEGLASALAKLQQTGRAMLQRGAPQPAPATVSLSVVNPLSGTGVFNLFSTHPPIEARIERLLKMARENGSRAWA